MKYMVFVDFDGVLTSNRVHFSHHDPKYPMWATFDPVVVEFFNRVDRTFDDVSFVWTTTWRNRVIPGLHTEHWAYSMWYNAGFRGQFAKQWRVNHEDDNRLHQFRAHEIKEYLEKWMPLDFVIIDDSDYGFNDTLGVKRFVKTSSDDGMLFKHMRDIWSMMGNWDRIRL